MTFFSIKRMHTLSVCPSLSVSACLSSFIFIRPAQAKQASEWLPGRGEAGRGGAGRATCAAALSGLRTTERPCWREHAFPCRARMFTRGEETCFYAAPPQGLRLPAGDSRRRGAALRGAVAFLARIGRGGQARWPRQRI